ncbi:hypothetical protein ACTWP5_18490 [Streptomyces sp. 4N509B]|uniref:hypothetical protein n=1 Tax=Streptomyces sp. 4N509B TaxID=3457413 RepID=UPI003FD082F3
MRGRRLRRAALLPSLLVAAGLGLAGAASAVAGTGSGAGAGSGADDGGGAPVGQADEQRDFDAMMREFAECLRANGMEVADPEPGQGVALNGDGQDPAVVEAAMEACREYDPAHWEQEPIAPEIEAALRDYSACMRDHGVEDFPDPVPGEGLQLDGAIEQDPDFDAADEACAALLPEGGGERGTHEVTE